MKKIKLCLVGLIVILASTPIFITSSSVSSYDPWIDTNDDGIIDVNDLVALGSIYGTSGESINKTALLLDLLDRVEALENQSTPLGYIGPPAYDSGWVSISPGETLTLPHNLGTTEVLVYVIGKHPTSLAINQFYYGYVFLTSGDVRGLSWFTLTDTSIKVLRGPDDTGAWEQVRVMIWKIQPTP